MDALDEAPVKNRRAASKRTDILRSQTTRSSTALPQWHTNPFFFIANTTILAMQLKGVYWTKPRGAEKHMAHETIEIVPVDRTGGAPMASTETRLRRALVRILSAAEGRPGFQPMNWSDVAEVARQALDTDSAIQLTTQRR